MATNHLVNGVDIDTLFAPIGTNIATGTGLSGGGNLSANRTLSFNTTWGDARYLGKSSKASDSNLLDGIDSSAFLRSNATDSFSGTLTYSGASNALLIGGASSGIKKMNNGNGVCIFADNGLLVFSGDSEDNYITGAALGTTNTSEELHLVSDANVVISPGQQDGFVTTNRLIVPSTGDLTFNGHEVWHAGNDGSGSGLDADRLDGVTSSSFVRSDADDTKTGTLQMQDNAYFKIGSGGDVEHFWNGTNYYTDINGGANWYIRDGNSANANRFTFDVDDGILTATTFSGSLSGNASTATSAGKLTTARTINGVSFNGTANITVDPYINNYQTGDTNCPIVFTLNSTAGHKRLYEDSALYFDNTNDRLYSPWFYGALSGNASTASKWSSARTLTTKLQGDVSGSASMSVDGSAAKTVTVTTTVANDSHNHTKLYDKGTIEYNWSGISYADLAGNGGTGLDGAEPGNPVENWCYHIIANHANSAGYYFDLAAAFHEDYLAYRRLTGGALGDWQRIYDDNYHPNADYAANADKLDGVTSGSFLRSDLDDTKTAGYLRFNDGVRLQIGNNNDWETYQSTGINTFTDMNTGGIWYIRDGNTSDAQRFSFDIDNGNFWAGGNVSAYSDVRLKSNIEPIDNALDKVCQLGGYTYDKALEIGSDKTFRDTGVLAQEVQEILPEAVVEGKDEDKILSVKYGNMVGLLIESIKELKAEIDELKKGAK